MVRSGSNPARPAVRTTAPGARRRYRLPAVTSGGCDPDEVQPSSRCCRGRSDDSACNRPTQLPSVRAIKISFARESVVSE